MQIVFKKMTRLGNNFHFKDQILKDLTSGVVYQFQYGLYNDLNIRTVKHYITIYQKTSQPKNSSVPSHLLFCNHTQHPMMILHPASVPAWLTGENFKF